MTNNDEKYTHCVAIVFGISGTGIAASAADNPDKVRVFSHWTTVKIGVDIKCPTVLLLDPDQNFEAFGVEALDLYQTKRNLKYPDRVAEYYLFNRFKMSLYSREKEITSKLKIKATNGKELPAVDVFAKSLEYMKIITLAKFEGYENPPRKILWTIPVPAIWSLAAKQIMQEAAYKGGIGNADNEDVIFPLEPEATIICFEKEILAVKKSKENEVDCLIVDCGGERIDIAAHRLSKDDDDNIFIEELAPPQESTSGSFSVNHLFEEMLWKLFKITDQEQIDEIKTKYAREWTNLVLKEFEEAKYLFEPKNSSQEFSIIVPDKLCHCIEKISRNTIEDLTDSFKEYTVSWDDEENALVLDFSTMARLFEPVVYKIITHIEQSLARPECHSIQTILLVGGFANSSFLFDEVKDAFAPKDIMVLKSFSPKFSELKGAVMYAQKQDIIRSRKMGQLIEIKVSQHYNRSIHDPSELEDVKGQLLCHQFIRINDDVKAGSTITHKFRPASKIKKEVFHKRSEDYLENYALSIEHTDFLCNIMRKSDIRVIKTSNTPLSNCQLIIRGIALPSVPTSSGILSEVEELSTSPKYDAPTQSQDLTTLKNQVEKLQIDHSSQMTTFNATVEKQKIDMQKNIEKLEVLLVDIQATNERLQLQLSDVQKTNAHLQNQLSSVNKNNELLQNQLSSVNKNNELLQNQLSLTQQQLLGVQSMITSSRLWVVSHDQFKIGREIGRGAWATVHETTFRGATVAAKCLHQIITAPGTRQLFQKEMEMALQCQHQNIVTFLGATLEGRQVILMELMDTSLRDAYEHGNIKDHQVLRIFHDTASALHFLHTRPDVVIHRDVSSANVLLKALYNGEWLAKLGDLGTAKIQRQTATAGPGAMAYGAPEAGDYTKHSPKMDVYSYGILILETLTATHPFQMVDALKAQVQQQFPRYHQLVTSCTNQQSSDRPTMYDVIGQLKKIKAS